MNMEKNDWSGEPYDADDMHDGIDSEDCWACGGEGYYHDCGEDTCCCLNPEEDDMFPCEECGGKGRL
jgi:hypothetical protein